MALVQMYTQKGERSWCLNLRRYYSLAATRLTCVRYPLVVDRESADQWYSTANAMIDTSESATASPATLPVTLFDDEIYGQVRPAGIVNRCNGIEPGSYPAAVGVHVTWPSLQS